jgi:predicted amidohydrolase
MKIRDKVKIAAVQMDPKIMKIEDNLNKIIMNIKMSAQNGAALVVFPECALTGYMYASREEAFPYTETIPGPSIEKMAGICKEYRVFTVVGMLEKAKDKCYNTAALIGPQGLIGRYRKVHLPYLGIDRYLDRGDEPYTVYPTSIGNLGLFICYDVNFPESARSMVLQGADILVLPTNWPEGRQKVPKYVIITRAFENKAHIVACDRVGKERGAGFLGLSKIVNAWGDTLAEAGNIAEETIYAQVSLADSREKHVVIKAGEFEYDYIHDRKPELYPGICDKNDG